MNYKMCLTILKKCQYRIWKNFSDWMSDSRLIAKNVKTGSLRTRSLITVRFLWNLAHCFSYRFCIYHLYWLLKILNLRYNKRKYLKAMWPLFSKLFYLSTESHNFLHEDHTSGQYCKSAKIFGKKYTVTMETQFVWRPYWICHIFQVSRTHLVISYT